MAQLQAAVPEQGTDSPPHFRKPDGNSVTPKSDTVLESVTTAEREPCAAEPYPRALPVGCWLPTGWASVAGSALYRCFVELQYLDTNWNTVGVTGLALPRR